jgi:flavin reductase (DIM6/NTAB) family NADH-FMN oxidoreductase RutF
MPDFALDAAEFRRILGHWTTGVAVVATRAGERLCGMTANSIASVSLKPPLVLACIEQNSDTHECIRQAGIFSINILCGTQERIARRFASWDVESKFQGLGFRQEVTGAPVLDDALAWLDCRVHSRHQEGDHTIFVGEVLAGDAKEDAPLIYYRGGYGRFMP